MLEKSSSGIASYLRGKLVAIVGGGPAGLTLARLLQMRGATVKVYERDATPDARNQGGSLDLHENSGQLALREAGLTRQFQAIARPEGQQARVFDMQGKLLVEMLAENEAQARPEVDRGQLRYLLLESLEPGTVEWGRQFVQAVPEGDGRHRLVFDGGESVVVDLLVGCDGAWSKVRPLLSAVKPSYSGVMFIETHIDSPDTRFPAISQLVGPGSMMALGDNKALMAQRNGDGHIRVYAALRVAADWIERSGVDFAEPVVVRERLIETFAGWASFIVDLLRISDDVYLPRPLYTLPPEQSWSSVAGVTLLGDAAHVMPPFTGRGANLAMLDAVELAECLAPGRFGTLTEAIRGYEKAMLLRMKFVIDETLASQDVMISADGPDAMVAAINEKMQGRREGS